MKRFTMLVLTGVMFLCLPALGLAFGGGGTHTHPDKKAPALPEDYTVAMQVPVFSEIFGNLPVAMVGDQPIRLSEMVSELKEVHDEMPLPISGSALTQRFNLVLDRLIEERLQKGGDPEVVTYAERQISKDRILVVQVPLLSPHFAFTPAASVNEDPIAMGEFARELGAMHADQEDSVEESYQPDNPANLLERLVVVRLVEQEARNMGLDQQGAVQRQVDGFAEKTLLYHLLGRQMDRIVPNEERVQKIYRDISLAAKLEDYRIPKQEDAESLRTALEAGGDFDALISQMVKEGKAIPGEMKDDVLFKNLLAQVASTAKEMEIGGVSPIFRVGKDFSVFKLLDRTFVEDPEALKVAGKIAWDQQTAEASKEYFTSVIDQYAVFAEEVREALKMNRIKEQNPDVVLSEVLSTFKEDHRTLVTVQADGKSHTLKVSEVAERLEKMYFHGTDIALKAQEADERLKQIVDDWIFRLAGAEEAKKLGLDKSLKYVMEVQEYERRTLFDHFIQKVVLPDVKLTEEEIRQYYNDNQEEYSTPAMLRLESLVFDDEDAASKALEKLSKGSDFKWVSANVKALVPSDDLPLLDFGKGILSMNALPEDFRKSAEGVKEGESVLYSGPQGYHYVVYFQKVFPPEPKPYEQVRSQVLETVYKERVNDVLMAYVEKLKEYYPTEVYLSLNKG